MTVWCTSDWHFGHRNILTLGSGRPFSSIEEHDEALIDRYNAVVRDDDLVWVLGDVAMGNIDQSLAKCARMNGMRNLVCGNHDRPAMTTDTAKRHRWTRRYINEGGFAAVLVLDERRPSMDIHIRGCCFAASHYPYQGDSTGTERYTDRRPVDDGRWLLHGHVHDTWRVQGRQINVGVDVWDFAPVSASQILSIAVA